MTYLRRLWHVWTAQRSFYVLYVNGERTYKMPYWEARNLTEIWRGEVVFDP